jgi:hypothetical protein
MRPLYTIALWLLVISSANSQPLKHAHNFTHADTLRGSNGPIPRLVGRYALRHNRAAGLRNQIH